MTGAAERANYQISLAELCDVLEVPRPDPTTPDEDENAYVFEKAITFQHGDGSTSVGRIGLYKRGRFVLTSEEFPTRANRVEELPQILVLLGQAREVEEGRYAAGI